MIDAVPSAWNLANVLTVLRIALVPFFAWALLADGGHTTTGRLIATGLFQRTLNAWKMNEYSGSPLNYVIWPSFAIAAIGSALLVVRALQAAIHPEKQDTHAVTVD